MQYYKIYGLFADGDCANENGSRYKARLRARSIAIKSSLFNQKQNGKIYLFVSDISDDSVTVGAICKECFEIKAKTDAFLNATELMLNEVFIEETTFNVFRDLLESASRRDYIHDDDEVLESFGLRRLTERSMGNVPYDENFIAETQKDEIYENAGRYLIKDSLVSELDRIYAGCSRVKASGHPVHYFVQTDDRDTRREVCRLLLQALYQNGRIINKRYCYVDIDPTDDFSVSFYDCLYKSNSGGAVLVRYLAQNVHEDDRADVSRDVIEKLCRVAKEYRNRVLTVFCLPRESTKSKEIFYENLCDMSFVDIKEECVSGERAVSYLKMIAKENGVKAEKSLIAALDPNESYLAPDLHRIFEKWYDKKIKTCYFPQYKDTACVARKVIEAKPKGSAYDQLMEMVGIDKAKEVIVRAIDFYKAQKLLANEGIKTDRPAMHMVFTGNPGSAKTTAARLFAGIMKENGLLSKGDLIEVGRGDLVGKYVGWTAQIIQKRFRQAQGSVLFIDEAYSLVDDRDGSFGDEAINTIVQEMENHRNDVVVIFAGYPDKMEGFLSKNPGLRSRIAFHIPFEDYGTDELCDIAALIARKSGFKLAEGVREKLAEVFDIAKTSADFGNGRYARNVIEKARMAQASRLVRMDLENIVKDELITIRAEDIEIPTVKANKRPVHIGFGAA